MYGKAWPVTIDAGDFAGSDGVRFAVAWLPGDPAAIAAGKWEARSFASWKDARDWAAYVHPQNPASRAVVVAAVYYGGLVAPGWWDGIKDYVQDRPDGVHVWHWQWCEQALRTAAHPGSPSQEPAPPTPEEIVSKVVRQYDRDKKLGDYADPDDDK